MGPEKEVWVLVWLCCLGQLLNRLSGYVWSEVIFKFMI